MIAFVQGTVRLIRAETIVVDVQGIGYEVYVSRPENKKRGSECFLYTYQHVREDAILLFGFDTEQDYEVFMRLIQVRGIGPKSALHIFGAISGKEMIEAIENDDIKRLKALPGIGAKTAGQIVLDLKGKFVSVDIKESVSDDPVWMETQEALASMGFKAAQIASIKKECLSLEDANTSMMLQQALRLLAK